MRQGEPGQKPDLGSPVEQRHVEDFVRQLAPRTEPVGLDLRILVEQLRDPVGGRDLNPLPALQRGKAAQVVLVRVDRNDVEPVAQPGPFG